MPNIMTGMGCVRDKALSHGSRSNSKLVSMAHGSERSQHPLGQVAHTEVVNGDLVSLDRDCIVPLSDSLPFAGVVSGVGQQGEGYTVSTFVRCSICVRIQGLTPDVKPGDRIYAVRNGSTEAFSLSGPGTEVGELLHVESLERETALIGVKLATDRRPFEVSGGRMSGSGLPA